eukprot:211161-Rhodomonas_salina.1
MRESVRAALHAASEGDVEPLAIPKEAWRLVSALHSRAWGAARLFQVCLLSGLTVRRVEGSKGEG